MRIGMNRANYDMVPEETDTGKVTLRDIGPWSRHPTVTNDAENVVREVFATMGDRRILYYDSEGELTELRHDGPRFTGFGFVASGGKTNNGVD